VEKFDASYSAKYFQKDGGRHKSKRQIEKAVLPVEKRKGLRYNNTNEVREEIP